MGKWFTLAVIGAIFWQQQEAIRPHLEPLYRIVPTVRVFMEMRSYQPGLQEYIQENRRPPRELTEWLDEEYPPKGDRRPSMDLFGHPYQADRDSELGWVLRSCGPDRVCRNEDDLLTSLSPEQ